MGKNKLFNSSAVLSISAILISVMTLVVLIYQTSIMREQQRMSVLPYLTISNYGTGTANVKVVLENSGVGPAFIKSSVIKWKGKRFNTDLATFFFENIPHPDSLKNIYHTNLSVATLIPAQRQINILEIRNSVSDSKKFQALYSKLTDGDFAYEIVYASVYHEEWRITFDTKLPQKIH
jgi:hypothetical protein